MTEELKDTSWVYVLVQNPEGEEQVVGQTDPQNDISFIPMFRDKDAAMQGVAHMAKEKGKKIEIQAIIYEDLKKYAAGGGFIIFELDDEGAVVDKHVPETGDAAG